MTMTRRRLLDNTFKKTVVGNPAIATDSLARMYPGITMQGWTEQDGTPTPEAPVPIVSAGTWDETAQKWEYEITITNTQTDPDKNQTVTLTADRPLTKWDKLEKRNDQWGWVYKSAEVVLNGGESWTQYNEVYKGFLLPHGIPFTAKRQEGYCENYRVLRTQSTNSGEGFWLGVNNDIIYAVFLRQYDSGLPDKGLQNWKDYLSSNPQTILTYSDTETFVPLTETEQAVMNALYTYRPTTALSNQQDCEMALTYKTRKGVGGGNLLDYWKLVNPAYWIGTTPTNAYKYFDIVLKNNTKYKLSCTKNNMNKDYIDVHPIDFGTAFYMGENPGTFNGNYAFGHEHLNTKQTEYQFTTTGNPYYLNLCIYPANKFTPENLHIVFDELLPGLKLQEVT